MIGKMIDLFLEGNIVDFNNDVSEDEKMKEYIKSRDKAYDEMMDVLNENQKSKVNTFIDALLYVQGAEEIRSNRSAFAMGVRLTAEAFILGKDK